ncbi:hypothetical protein CSC73_01735 [Pseudoxanthomonas sacheonensis]|nr:hypothetical protein CSC73_01735 [Pseudoxanthomonas sacheonensis]
MPRGAVGRDVLRLPGRDRTLAFSARSGGAEALIGDVLSSPSASVVEFEVSAGNLSGAHIEVIEDGRILQPGADLSIGQTSQTLRFDWRNDGAGGTGCA